MGRHWVDCDRDTVSNRYNRVARLIPFFDRLLFLPGDLRAKAAGRLGLGRGDCVLDIGCGTGANLSHLCDAVGPSGRIFGLDISRGMLARARALSAAKGWRNVELIECDAADFTAPVPLDGVLFSLSYNTMPHHRAVLRKAWEQLRSGGALVIMDAKLPPGLGGRLILPFTLWLMKHTLLGNPLIRPWEEIEAIAGAIEMSTCRFSSYYICRAVKPAAATAPQAREATGRATFAVAAE